MVTTRFDTVLAATTLVTLAFAGLGSTMGEESQGNPGTRSEITLNGISFAFRRCPSGQFMMGSPESARAQYGDQFVPQHDVRISRGFWLQETEVTQAQYSMVTGENPSFLQSQNGSKLSDPVERVSWVDAVNFCERLSELDPDHDYRLPTESEWEYACRGGEPECRHGEIMEIAWVFMNTDEGNGSTGHRAVGMKQPNGWGLHDMFGNVAEWCSDWKGPAPSESTDDPAGPETGDARIVRGDDCFVCWTFLREDGACMAGSRLPACRPPGSRTRSGMRSSDSWFRRCRKEPCSQNASP